MDRLNDPGWWTDVALDGVFAAILGGLVTGYDCIWIPSDLDPGANRDLDVG